MDQNNIFSYNCLIVVKVTESGKVQSLTFIMHRVSEKIALLKIFNMSNTQIAV